MAGTCLLLFFPKAQPRYHYFPRHWSFRQIRHTSYDRRFLNLSPEWHHGFPPNFLPPIKFVIDIGPSTQASGYGVIFDFPCSHFRLEYKKGIPLSLHFRLLGVFRNFSPFLGVCRFPYESVIFSSLVANEGPF